MAYLDVLGIKWNFQHESVKSMIQGMTKVDKFTDVTIVSGDEVLDYQVHKFMLGAVSPVFKKILLTNFHMCLQGNTNEKFEEPSGKCS